MVALSLAGALAVAAIAGQPAFPAVDGKVDIDDLLSRMTVAEKLGRLTQLPGGRAKAVNSRIDDALRDRVRDGTVGSLLNVAGAEATRELQRIAVEESRLGIPLLYGLDVVHGYGTIFPVPIAVAASFDPAVAGRAAQVAAAEASAAGVHSTFAPMVDVAPDPRWGRIVEGAGEDPFLGAAMAVAQVRGYPGAGLDRPGTIMAPPSISPATAPPPAAATMTAPRSASACSPSCICRRSTPPPRPESVRSWRPATRSTACRCMPMPHCSAAPCAATGPGPGRW